MSYLVSLIRRHPLISFFVLAYALSWWPIAFYAAGLSPSTIISFGPFLAALVVLAATQGKTGVVTAAAAALNVLLLGAKASSSVAELGGLTGLFSTFALLLLIPGIGGSWEEPGWRGYALPRLQTARSALFASLILGVVWAFWHLPLFITGQQQWSDIVFIIVWTITFTWVFNNAEGSVLIVVLMHNMNNTISGAFFNQMFSGAAAVSQAWLYTALWGVVAIVLVVVYGPTHLSRKHRKQEEPAQQPAGDTAPRVV